MKYTKYILLIIVLLLGTTVLFSDTTISAVKETIIKDGVTYTLKTRSSIKAKLMDKVYVKGKAKVIELKDNKWSLKDKVAVIE